MRVTMAGLSRWVCLAAVAAGCGAPVPSELAEEGIDSTEQALEEALLADRTWKGATILPRRRNLDGRNIDYIACARQPFKMGFTFKNVGDAVWRDVVPGRDKAPGTDVLAVAVDANLMARPDPITGIQYVSVNQTQNNWVKYQPDAPLCAKERGCRKTVFSPATQGAFVTAPEKPGIYRSRWRLRDFQPGGTSVRIKGGRAGLSFEVKSCSAPACGCWLWCNDGSESKVLAKVDSTGCMQQAFTQCQDRGGLLVHQYLPCPDFVPGFGGSPGTGGSPGGGGTSGSSGSPGFGGTSGSSGSARSSDWSSPKGAEDPRQALVRPVTKTFAFLGHRHVCVRDNRDFGRHRCAPIESQGAALRKRRPRRVGATCRGPQGSIAGR
jgi:uncharacterized membrane protein YgcG